MNCSHCEGYAKRIEELQKIVDRLPQTADGVPITPGDMVFYLGASGSIYGCIFLGIDYEPVVYTLRTLLDRKTGQCFAFPHSIFSTSEAAENAAKENKS